MNETRRLAAIVAADMVGYSRLMGQDEQGTVRALQALRRDVIDPAMQGRGGRLAKTTGDGLLIEFPSVVEAVQFSVDVQTAIAARGADAPAERRTAFRVGINLGDIIDDGDEIYGDGINIAARLESIAPPGGVALSQTVYDSVVDKLDVRFADAGSQQLKNIANPVRVFTWHPRKAAARKSPAYWRYAFGIAAVAAAGTVLVVAVPPLRETVVAGWRSVAGGGVDVPVRAAARVSHASLAVLPFLNLSADPAEDYFSDGLTEDVIAALGRFSDLTVMSRNAVSPFKDRAVQSGEIAQELGVTYLVEGSVRRGGDRVRVHVRLAEADTGKVLWSQQYDADQEDVFAVQDSISRNIAGALTSSLIREEERQALGKPTESLGAYDLVLRGRQEIRENTRQTNRRARELFDSALELDPDYAGAYASKALALVTTVDMGWAEDPRQSLDEAASLGAKALQLDPENIQALTAQAYVAAYSTDHAAALAAAERILEINPNDPAGYFGRGHVLLFLGRIDEAIAALSAGYRFDPNPMDNSEIELALAYHLGQRDEDAIRVLKHAQARFPDNPFVYAVLAAAYGRSGQMASAQRAVAELRRTSPFFHLKRFGEKLEPEHQRYLQDGLRLAGMTEGVD